MYQGETITTVITNFPIPISEMDELYIIFKRGCSTILEKSLKDCSIDEEEQSVTFTLTQEESLSLQQGTINRSVILITKDGSRIESASSPFSCYKTAKNEVL